ncbi:hypothetical protein [uncultured Deinococcus sp.]|uniref:hypothetical protein n=1 Tax=uncultured Deinococcus sp. TaxID=158789 RepID=UPI00374A57B6
MTTIEIFTPLGSIHLACQEAVRRAEDAGQAVILMFNGTAVPVYPSTHPHEAARLYWAVRDARDAAFLALTRDARPQP